MKRWIILPALGALLLAACAPSPGPTDAPATVTQAVSGTEAAPTPTVELPTRRPLPPTWTPAGEVAPTLTPTWTPRPFTPIPSATRPPECDAFRADAERIPETFPLGTAPTIYWTPAPNVQQYRVEIIDPTGEVVYIGWAEAGSDSHTVPAEVFEVSEDLQAVSDMLVFGWQVTPMDGNMVMLCHTIAGEFLPNMATTATPAS